MNALSALEASSRSILECTSSRIFYKIGNVVSFLALLCAVNVTIFSRHDILLSSAIKVNWTLSTIIYCNISELKNVQYYMA